MIRVPCDVAAFNASDELCRERRVPVNLGEQMSCAIGADLILCLSAARGGGRAPHKSGIVSVMGFHLTETRICLQTMMVMKCHF